MIEVALAQVVRNRVEAAYARSDLFERRRVLMKDWRNIWSRGRGGHFGRPGKQEDRQFDVTPLIAWTHQHLRGSIACSITHPTHDSVLEVSTEIGHPIRLNQIRPFFQPVLAHFPKPGAKPEILENDLFLTLLEEFFSQHHSWAKRIEWC